MNFGIKRIMPSNLIHIHHRSQNHAGKSGYSRLTDYMPVTSIYGNTRLPYYVAKLVSKPHSNKRGLYNAGSVWKEAELLEHLRRSRKESSVVHYLNAERDVRYFVKFRKFFPVTKFCGTFHKPPEVLYQTITDFKILQNLHGAIAVGENQVEFLKEKLRLQNIAFIPHGVDTEFFTPDRVKKESNTIIFVGNHLRDFDAFNFCIPRISEKVKGLKVHVVLPKDHQNKITPHGSITIHSDIHDFELRNLYNCSSLLFLPLREATACNSLLEGLACGLPIVSTDVGGNRFYLEGTKNLLLPKGDNNAYIDAVAHLLSRPETLQEMAISSREKALTLSWEKIAQKVTAFYEDISKE